MICTVEAVCGETVFLGGLDVRYSWHVTYYFTHLVKRLRNRGLLSPWHPCDLGLAQSGCTRLGVEPAS